MKREKSLLDYFKSFTYQVAQKAGARLQMRDFDTLPDETLIYHTL